MADPREEAIRRHYYQPRSLMAEKAAGSRPGQVYHTMTSLQDRMSRPGYTPAQADTDQLKALRRDWNRNQKYTPQGMRVSGATSPLDAQKRFMDTTETFRQANPRAYGTMYPLSQAAMKLGEYGGLLGLGVRGLTGQLGDYYKSIMNKDGINAALDTNKDELENYANLTYGPHLEGIEELDLTREYEGPRPHEGLPIEEPLLVDEEQGLSGEDEIRKVLEDPGFDTSAEFLLTPPKTKEELRQEELLRELEENMVFSDAAEDVEPLPFDEGKEDYIAASGINPYLLRDEKLESIHPEDQRMFERMTPHRDREVPTNIGVEFGVQDEIPPINYDYDPRTESGIMDAMRWSPPRQAFPPIGPHDPFDPDQRIFENRAKYDEWLRRQRMGP